MKENSPLLNPSEWKAMAPSFVTCFLAGPDLLLWVPLVGNGTDCCVTHDYPRGGTMAQSYGRGEDSAGIRHQEQQYGPLRKPGEVSAVHCECNQDEADALQNPTVVIPAFVIWNWMCVRLSSAHIVLTFPPARKYALDFLDNLHAPEPCGMPRGLEEPYYLEAGSEFNVTWHEAYPHQGGYILELLDTNYDRISTLVPAVAGREPRALHFQYGPSLELSHPVTIPKNVRCENCTIRIIRQAVEWNNLTSDPEGYLFRSCADVNIVDPVDTSYKCSNHGTWTGTECLCEDLYTGNACQYKDVCNRESHCSSHGRCLDTNSTSYPKKRCFCVSGWQGTTCSRASTLKVRVVNKAYFAHRQLADGFDLYWKIDRELGDIEFVVQSKSLSWIALGWRPMNITSKCRGNFPRLPDEVYVPHGAALVSSADIGPLHWSINPRSLDDDRLFLSYPISSDTEFSIRPRRDVSAMSTNATGWLLDINGTLSGNLTPEAVPLSSAHANLDELHPMDCTDMVIGTARTTFGQVQDSYTRDRSTPQADVFYGGTDSLLAAIAYEEDGVTTMRFRRPLAAVEPTDHSFVNDPMHIIFARGVESARYKRATDEFANVSVADFFRPDELKYHGSSPANRGFTTINFFDEKRPQNLSAPCFGEWKSPANCVGTGCRYTARWEYLDDSDSVYFKIQTRSKDRWTGIGFAPKFEHMPESDVIVGWVDDEGKVQITDRYAEGYRAPKLDKIQSLQNLAGSVNDAFVTIEFTRPRVTNDSDDFDFRDGSCAFFMFPVDGGRFDKVSGVISKHMYQPSVSQSRICIGSCSGNASVWRPVPMLQSGAALGALGRADFPNDSPVPVEMRVVNTTQLTTALPPATTARVLNITGATSTAVTTFPASTVPVTKEVSKPTLNVTQPFTTAPTTTTVLHVPLVSTTQSSTVTTRTAGTTSSVTSAAPVTTQNTTISALSAWSKTIAALLSTATNAVKLTTTSAISTILTATTPTSAATTTPSTRPAFVSTKNAESVTGRGWVELWNSTGSSLAAGSSGATAASTAPSTKPLPRIVGAGQHSNCRGEWRSPANCVAEKCEYVAMWELYEGSNEIQFFVQSAHPDRWTGIGLSPTGKMPQSDVVYGYQQPHGNVVVIQATTEGYYPPVNNSDQDITNVMGWVKDGFLGISFRRNRTLDGDLWGVGETCPFFLFPYSGGSVIRDAGAPTKHFQTPVASEGRICVESCPFLPSIPTATSTEAATTITATTRTTATTTQPPTTTLMPVIEGTPCRAIFSYPRNCNTSNCIYVAQWDYIQETDEINFLIQSNRVGTWSGIGFSEKGEMVNSDIIVGWVGSEGRPTISDRWATAYAEPQRDLQQDVTRLGGAIRYGTQLITFTRKRQTEDERDFQFNDTSCPYMIFPVFGGTYDELSEVIDKHEDTPVVSDQPICIRACRKKSTMPLLSLANGLGLQSSSIAKMLDQKMIMLDPSLLSSIAMTSSGSGITTHSTRSFSRDRTVNFAGLNLFTKDPANTRKTAPTRTTHANLTFRSRTSGMLGGTVALDASRGATTTPSPDDILTQLLMEAGISGVSVEKVAEVSPDTTTVRSTTTAKVSTLATRGNNSVTKSSGDVVKLLKDSVSGLSGVSGNAPATVLPLTTVLGSRQDILTGNITRIGSSYAGPVSAKVFTTGVPSSHITSAPVTFVRTDLSTTSFITPTVTSPAYTNATGLSSEMVALASLVLDRVTTAAPVPSSIPQTIVPPPGAVLVSVTGQTVPFSPPSYTLTSPSVTPFFGPSTVVTPGAIAVFPADGILHTDPHRDGMEVKSSDNLVTGVNLGTVPNQVGTPRPRETYIGPLPSTSQIGYSVSMTPQQMLTSLMGYSTTGSGTVSLIGTVPAIDTATMTSPRMTGTLNTGTSVTRPDYSMSSSVMIPSILPAPATLPDNDVTVPPFAFRVEDRPGDVMMGEASDVVAKAMSPAAQQALLAAAADADDQGTIGDDPHCGQYFKFPSDCLKDNCSYVATWRPGSNVDEIEFTVETDTPSFWTGIGFSDDKLMKGSDIIYTFIRSNGVPKAVDAFAKDYVMPARDFRNDVRVIDGGRKNGRAYFRFARKLVTNDPNDYEFGHGRCPHFKLPVLGSSFDQNTNTITKHQRTPIVSPKPVCLVSCDRAAVSAAIAAQEAERKATVPPSTTPRIAAPMLAVRNGLTVINAAASAQSPPSTTGNNGTLLKTSMTAGGQNGSNSAGSEKSVLSCIGEFRYPDGCTENSCDYVAQWEYLPATDDIKFDIGTAKSDEWTGIGFNDKPQMPSADIIYGWVDDSGKPLVTDAFAPDGHMTPVRDVRQDAKNVSAMKTDRLSIFSFIRKRSTKDDRDYQFTDTKCPYFLFPVRGGDFDANALMILKHKNTPLISTQRICVTSACSAAMAPSAGTRKSDVQPPPPPKPSGKGAAGPSGKGSVSETDSGSDANSTRLATTASPYTSYLPCEGTWKYPENCVEPNCIYVAQWTYLDDADAIRFVVKAKAAGWTGIGFNDDMAMKNADAYVGWVTSKNTVAVTDRYCVDNSGAPMDDEQSVYDISGRREDGYQVIEFTRKRDTLDPNGQDYTFGDQKCPFFIFPIVGGSYDSYGTILAHSQKALPKFSSGRICVRSCNIDVPRRMVVSFRIVDRSWEPDLESRKTDAFHKLETDISNPIRQLLGNTPGFRGVRVISFRPGSVIVDTEIVIDPTANQTSAASAKIMGAILKSQIEQRHQLGVFALDPKSLSISPAEEISPNAGNTMPTDSTTIASANKAPESEVRTYAIIGGVCGIIAILLFLAFGKVYYDRKSRIERRRERARRLTSDVLGVNGGQPPPPAQYPRRQSRSSSIEAVRPEVYGLPRPPYEMQHNGHKPRNGHAASVATRSSAASLPPPDYYPDDIGDKPRKTRKTHSMPIVDDHPLHRLSHDESDRTLTTYSSNNSRKDRKAAMEADLQDDWGSVDEKYHRPPDFYFMPSQRRWTQVPQDF